MQLTLTWDLLVIIFFATIIAYSFIVGKDASVKIIIATYIGVVAVQGAGNLLTKLSVDSGSLLQMLDVPLDAQWISLGKIVLFVALVLFLALRGGFEMEYAKEITGIWDTALTGLFGFGTAGLMLSTLLTYIAGGPILDAGLSQAPVIVPLLAQSTLIQIMVHQQDVWFALPAFLLLGVGLMSRRAE